MGILTFSCVVKVPQIVAVAQSKSASGLAPVAFELEQLALCIHTAYGFLLSLPFTAYGEAAIICLQNTYLLAQIYWYSNTPIWRRAATAVGVGSAITGVLAGEKSASSPLVHCIPLKNPAKMDAAGRITQEVIRHAYDMNNVIFLAARVPQIVQNYKVIL